MLVPFDFREFARNIYQEHFSIHPEPYLLPALYGGESSYIYEALFVLQAPSVSFTETRWRQCNNPETAIQQHRAIFLDWAYRGYQFHLFTAFGPEPSINFFRRLYVTDVWKDAGISKCIFENSEYKRYWRSKLAFELENVPTRCVITVGREAQIEVGMLKRKGFLRPDTQLLHISFPSGQQRGITQEGYKNEVATLIEQLS